MNPLRMTSLLAAIGLVCASYDVSAAYGLVQLQANNSSLHYLTLPQYPALRRRGAKRSYALRQWHGVQRMINYPTAIQHVVVIDMENRTVDNLFDGYFGTPFRGGPQTWDQVMSLYN